MPKQHDAFISYSHSADGVLAPALESALERLAKPLFSLRAIDVFRDKTSLSASPALWSGILDHLSGSRWFVLLASPQSAASPWCAKEVAWWLEHRGVSTLLVVLTDGELVWDETAGDFDWERTSALSPALRGRFTEEPFYCDLRWARGARTLTLRDTRFRSAALDIAATIRGVPKDQLDGEDVRQLRRTRRLARAGVAAIALAAAVAIWQAIEATGQRRVAEMERDRAVSRQLAAQAGELRERDPRLALLLAAQALAAYPSAEASSSILRVLNAAPVDLIGEHGESTWSLAVADDERWAAVGDGSGATVRVDLQTGRVEPLIPAAGDRGPVSSATLAVAVSPDGETVASGGFDQAITIARGTDVVRRIPGGGNAHEGFVMGLAFSPDGRMLASAGSDGRVLLHDLDSGAVQTLAEGWTPEMSAVRFSPDGRMLAAGGDAATVRLFPRAPGVRPPVVQGVGGASVQALAFVRGGARLVAAFFDRSVGVYDTASGTLLGRIDAAEHAFVESMAVAPDGDRVFTGHGDGSVIAWTSAHGSAWTSERLYRHSAAVKGLAFLPRSDRLVSLAHDGRLFAGRPSMLPPLTRGLWRAPDAFHAAALVEGGRRIVLVAENGWTAADPATGAPAPAGEADQVVLAGVAGIRHEALAHDGRGRALVRRDTAVVIEQGGAGGGVELRLDGEEPLSAAVFSPDGGIVYGVRGDELLAWDAGSGAPRAQRRALPKALLRTLAVSPDGQLLAIAQPPGIDFGATGRRSQAHQVTLLRAGDFQVVGEGLESIPGAGGPGGGLWGEKLFFTPDSRMLALHTGSALTLWTLTPLQRLDEPLRLPAYGQAVGFAADPAQLLVAMPTRQSMVGVDLSPDRWAAEACRLAARSVTREEWARYVGPDAEYRPACVDGQLRPRR
jgi:WD40 repeat protein